jgi:pimeloyl-ACP methyl ester carboxylesterase
MRSSVVLASLLLAGCSTMPPPQSAAPVAVPTGLYSETFGPASGASVKTLIVVVHADDQPSHYAFAAAVAKAIPQSAAVAVLRPGYADRTGHSSPGDRGNGTGDNYTADRITAVGDAIAELRGRYPNARTILVGDAGGAAIAANLAGTRPTLIDGIVLVSCPCTLPEWRARMEKRDPAWGVAVTSLDPLKTSGGVLPTLRAAVLVGADDSVTPIPFSRAYAEALTLRGIATDYRIVPGKGHEMLDDPEVLGATTRLAAALAKKG